MLGAEFKVGLQHFCSAYPLSCVGLMSEELISALLSHMTIRVEERWGSCGLTLHLIGGKLRVRSNARIIIKVT